MIRISFANIIDGDETLIHYSQPKRKSSDRAGAIKNTSQPTAGKHSRTVKKVLFVLFFTNSYTVEKVL